jgi:NAD+ kinase
MKLAFSPSQRPEAQSAAQRLRARYGSWTEAEADVVVALGGDGGMLETLRRRFDDNKPVYGMHRGTVGFLMNEFSEDGLVERIVLAERALISPIRMRAIDLAGQVHLYHAINEISLLRQTAQTARLRILIDGRERMSELICDGALVATPAGSTAYNFSAHGPILPIGANLLALTPISPFRPRRWRGALLRHDALVRLEVMEATRRPVAASADNQEVRDVTSVEIETDRSKALSLLFDPGHALDERILREQFMI